MLVLAIEFSKGNRTRAARGSTASGRQEVGPEADVTLHMDTPARGRYVGAMPPENGTEESRLSWRRTPRTRLVSVLACKGCGQ
jgi:hypothetical protein